MIRSWEARSSPRSLVLMGPHSMGLPVMQFSSLIPLRSWAAHQVIIGHNSICIFHEPLTLDGGLKRDGGEGEVRAWTKGPLCLPSLIYWLFSELLWCAGLGDRSWGSEDGMTGRGCALRELCAAWRRTRHFRHPWMFLRQQSSQNAKGDWAGVTFEWLGRSLCRADIRAETSVARRSWPFEQVWEGCSRQRES